MSDLKMSSIPQMTVGKTVQRLTAFYCGAVEKNVPFRCLPSIMLWGPPGVGKSQAVRQLGREIETNTGKTVTVTFLPPCTPTKESTADAICKETVDKITAAF